MTKQENIEKIEQEMLEDIEKIVETEKKVADKIKKDKHFRENFFAISNTLTYIPKEAHMMTFVKFLSMALQRKIIKINKQSMEKQERLDEINHIKSKLIDEISKSLNIKL